MTLKERIDRRQDTIQPIVERRNPDPAWVRRMVEGNLKAKDTTGRAS